MARPSDECWPSMARTPTTTSLGLPLSVRPTAGQGTLPAVVGSPPVGGSGTWGFRTLRSALASLFRAPSELEVML